MYMSEKEFQKLIEEKPYLVKSELSKNKKTKNKYRNIKVYEYSDGYTSVLNSQNEHGAITSTFDSVKEYNRWNQLKLLEKAGEITELERQKTLLIQEAFVYNASAAPQKINKINYIADFVYKKDGIQFVEDVKPFDEEKNKYRLTKDFQLKWKLLKYRYPDYQFILF